MNCAIGGGNVCLAAAPVSLLRRTDPIADQLLGAKFSKNGSGGGWGEDRLLRGQENVLMGGKEIEGNILEGGELRRMGCCW